MMKQITAHELTAMSEQAASVACARTALYEELSDPVQRGRSPWNPAPISARTVTRKRELLTPLRVLSCCSSTMTAS